ncbi:MAG: SCO family protein [Leptospiraceae bacterium]|nr:SCO family protein [Leptospiraceae bacterium]
MGLYRKFTVGWLALLIGAGLWGADSLPEGIGIEEKLGQGIPVGPEFYLENGQVVALEAFLKRTPVVIIAPVYYTCPNLCNFVLNGLMRAIAREKSLRPGRDYIVVSFSINPLESYTLAQAKKDNYLSKLHEERRDLTREEMEKAWFFLTADREENIQSLTNALGFYYRREGIEYLHQAGIIFVSSEGVISRYLYGIDFPPNDFKMAILETAQGKLGGLSERLAMYCFSYDPVKKKYSLVAWRVMRLAAGGGALIFLVILGFLWYKESQKKKKRNKGMEQLT